MKVVIIFIEYYGRVLIGKKVVKSGHEFSDTWHVPGGTVGAKEAIIDAVKREAKEETNLKVTIIESLGNFVYDGKDLYVYLTRPTGNIKNLHANDDLQEVKFVEKSKVLELFSQQRKRFWPNKVLEYLSN